jgi:hypothetical protein
LHSAIIEIIFNTIKNTVKNYKSVSIKANHSLMFKSDYGFLNIELLPFDKQFQFVLNSKKASKIQVVSIAALDYIEPSLSFFLETGEFSEDEFTKHLDAFKREYIEMERLEGLYEIFSFE